MLFHSSANCQNVRVEYDVIRVEVNAINKDIVRTGTNSIFVLNGSRLNINVATQTEPIVFSQCIAKLLRICSEIKRKRKRDLLVNNIFHKH